MELEHPWKIINASQEFQELFQLASTSCEGRPLAIVWGPKTNSVRVTEMLEAARHGLDTTANLVLYARTGQENSFFVQAQPFGSRLAPSGCMVTITSGRARRGRGRTGERTGERVCERWVHTVAHAAAVASEMMWLGYEVGREGRRRAGGSVPQLCSFSAQRSLGKELADAAPLRELAARTEAIRLAGAYDGLRARNVTVRGAPVLSPTDLKLLGVLGGRQSGAVLPTWEGWDEWLETEALFWDKWGEWQGDDGDDAARMSATQSVSAFWVLTMEAKMWIEIDVLVRKLRRINQDLPLPPQLLALLPPPPPEGWPADFMLHLMAEYMLDGETPLAVRAGEHYNELRRAQKLSYAAWCLLGLDRKTSEDVSRPMTSDGQAILETARTQDRLALLLHVITGINNRLP